MWYLRSLRPVTQICLPLYFGSFFRYQHKRMVSVGVLNCFCSAMVEAAFGSCPAQVNWTLAGSFGFLAAACFFPLFFPFPFLSIPPALPAHTQTLHYISYVQDHFLSSIQVAQLPVRSIERLLWHPGISCNSCFSIHVQNPNNPACLSLSCGPLSLTQAYGAISIMPSSWPPKDWQRKAAAEWHCRMCSSPANRRAVWSF